MWYLRRLRWWLQNRFYRLRALLKRWWQGLGIGVALWKLAGVGKIIGLGKIVKMAWMLGSMLLFVWFFALSYGWAFAAGLGALIFVHEMGHALAALLVGMEVSLPIFIPFLGAFISLKRVPKSAVEEAFIGAGGPVAGTLATLVCLGIYFSTLHPLWLGLAYTGAFMHLFNLLPIAPLDGGRMVAPLSRWVWYPMLPLALFGGLYTGNFLLLLIVWFGLSELQRTWGPGAREYFQATLVQRLVAALVYFGLLGLNALVFWVILTLDHAQNLGAPDLSEGRMTWQAAALITAVLTVGYATWQWWQQRRRAQVHAAIRQVNPRLARLKALRLYRVLGVRYGKRWRIRYRGPRTAGTGSMRPSGRLL
jgi:Zn-dependent protease